MHIVLKFNHTFFFIVILFCSCVVYSQDSCSNSPLVLTSLPFNTSSLQCSPVWPAQNFILRYGQETPNLWSFVLSVPNPNAFVGMGFSSNGQMVGSTAMVGWAATDGTASIRKYFLGGKSPNLVSIQGSNQGLQVTNTYALLQGNQLYLAFQLPASNPSTRLICAVGPTGRFPVAPDFRLTQHSVEISTVLNYATGEFKKESSPEENLKKSHGILNMLGWGILLPIGVMVARYMRMRERWDPLWFYLHAIIQSIAFTLGTIGIICGLVLENRLDIAVTKHKTIGVVILVLGSLQVMAVLFRPDKTSKVRNVWNLYHHNVGRLVIILGAFNVFYGVHLANGGSTWNTGFAAILVVLFVISLILELRMCFNK